MSDNIVLTGLMGCGKTSVGKALSRILKDYTFIDVDDVIVDIESSSISDIFSTKGEAYFREIEKNIIKELSDEEDLIIALGGGAFEAAETREVLSQTGIVFYLKANVETLYNRLKTDTTRPLLQSENPKETLKELLIKREPNYIKAEYTIEVDNKDINTIAEEILSII